MQSAQARADLLAHAGRALYGRRWVLPLGDALNVTRHIFQSWTAGKGQIPANVWPEILGLVQAKQRELRSAVRLLRARITEDKAAQLAIVARRIRNVIRDP